jgi:3-oxoacyl-[acyl-carrier-protein] synthase-1
MAVSSPSHHGPSRKVCILGCGALTALGYNAPMNAASVRANSSRFGESYMVDKAGEPMLLSMVDFVGDELRGLERLAALAVPALQEAIAPLLRDNSGQRMLSEAGICLGVASPRPGLENNIGESLLSRLGIELSIPLSKKRQYVIPAGHASALLGVGKAVEWISSGKVDLALVGGVDSYYDPDTLEWLDETKRLHSEANKDGFIPGEGAGFCLLSSLDFSNRYRLKPLAGVFSTASSEEPQPLTSDGVCIGQGLTNTLRDTLAVLTSEDQVADWTVCDMNGESFRSMEWVYAYLRTGARHRDPLEIWHPADCYGDIGAASGSVLSSIAIAAWQRNYARGDCVLIWTSSEGKERSAVLLKKPHVN